MHHSTTVPRQQAHKGPAALTQLQQQTQHQLQPEPQLQPQPQSQADAHANARVREAAQHAKATHAQAEYQRLQLHFAQLQQHDIVKCPARARLLRLSRAFPSASGNLALPGSELGLLGATQSVPPN